MYFEIKTLLVIRTRDYDKFYRHLSVLTRVKYYIKVVCEI